MPIGLVDGALIGSQLLTGASVTTSIATGNSERIGTWFWDNVYLLSSQRLLSGEMKPGRFFYTLLNFVMNHQKETHTQRLDVDAEALFLLKSEEVDRQIRDYFFRDDGSIRKNYILIPRKGFFIKSVRSSDGLWTWLYVQPIIGNGRLIGFDIWTYQWWWDWFSLSRDLARQLMNQTIEQYSSFTGIDNRIKMIANRSNEYQTFLTEIYEDSTSDLEQ